MSAANKGVLSTARTEEGSKILTRSQKEPSTKVPGFLLLKQPKLCFWQQYFVNQMHYTIRSTNICCRHVRITNHHFVIFDRYF